MASGIRLTLTQHQAEVLLQAIDLIVSDEDAKEVYDADEIRYAKQAFNRLLTAISRQRRKEVESQPQ